MPVTDKKELKELPLKVIKSSILGGGIARINKDDLQEIGFDQTSNLSVSSEEKGVILKTVPDKITEKGTIIIREKDMGRLEIEEGDTVLVGDYETLKSEIKEDLSKIKEKVFSIPKKIGEKLSKKESEEEE